MADDDIYEKPHARPPQSSPPVQWRFTIGARRWFDHVRRKRLVHRRRYGSGWRGRRKRFVGRHYDGRRQYVGGRQYREWR